MKNDLSALCDLYKTRRRIRYEFNAQIGGCAISGEMNLPDLDSEERFWVGTKILFEVLHAQMDVSLEEMNEENLVLWRKK